MFLPALTILAFATEMSAHLIAVIVFIVAMLLWLVAGIEWTGDGVAYRRIGGGLLPWLAVATLAYLTL